MNKPTAQWLENTQLDYFNTAANILGYSNLPLAWGLSLVSWKSKDDLNSFLDAFAYGQSGPGQGAA